MVPLKFSQKIADQVCALLIDGVSLVKICEREGMPSRSTLHKWLEQRPAFQLAYQQARQIWADTMFSRIWEIADGGSAEDTQRDRLRVDSLKWMLARINPRRYSERLELTGAEGSPLNPPRDATDYDTIKTLAFLLTEGASKEAKRPSAQPGPIALLPAPPGPVRIAEKQRRNDPRFDALGDVLPDREPPSRGPLREPVQFIPSADEQGWGGGRMPKGLSRR